TSKAWHYRKPYIESWWRPNLTRGYLYLDTAPTNDLLPWSLNSPPYRISDDNTKLLKKTHHVAPIMVRMVHAVIEVFREEREGVRWYVMGDDDSVFFVDNMVDVLAQYDHTKYIYIGGHSECIYSNQIYSYDMGFGGAGLIMSYPLAKMVQKNIEDCFARYPYLNSADKILMTCVNDFGVSLTSHQGLHQIDLHGDISGFLASHPKAPLLSLHHPDQVDPLFHSMDRVESIKHLMKAANVDQSRMVQQTICYQRKTNWSFSVSWGYSVHIYESIIPRSILKIPLETFKPWNSNSQPPFYIFNTRPVLDDPCVAPHVFSFESIKRKKNEIITNYLRVASRGLPACGLAGSRSSDLVKKIIVVSPVRKPNLNGKTECCDVINTNDARVAKLILRDCLEDETFHPGNPINIVFTRIWFANAGFTEVQGLKVNFLQRWRVQSED
ncbi:glycoprotein-N-acetylgalactosamine 3-beta-galactosyltransferase, partial [Tanacetum coccineum]